MRIELTFQAWKACVLPLNYARLYSSLFRGIYKWAGKDSNLRSASAADLQSALVDHLSTCPKIYHQISLDKSRREASNPRPADYKSAALPTELRRLKYPTNHGNLAPSRIMKHKYTKILRRCKG